MITETRTTRRVCDRCKEWVEYGNTHDGPALTGWVSFRRSFGSYQIGVDLCPGCHDAFDEWMRHADGDDRG